MKTVPSRHTTYAGSNNNGEPFLYNIDFPAKVRTSGIFQVTRANVTNKLQYNITSTSQPLGQWVGIVVRVWEDLTERNTKCNLNDGKTIMKHDLDLKGRRQSYAVTVTYRYHCKMENLSPGTDLTAKWGRGTWNSRDNNERTSHAQI